MFFILHLPSFMMSRTRRYIPFYSSLIIPLAFIDEIERGDLNNEFVKDTMIVESVFLSKCCLELCPS